MVRRFLLNTREKSKGGPQPDSPPPSREYAEKGAERLLRPRAERRKGAGGGKKRGTAAITRCLVPHAATPRDTPPWCGRHSAASPPWRRRHFAPPRPSRGRHPATLPAPGRLPASPRRWAAGAAARQAAPCPGRPALSAGRVACGAGTPAGREERAGGPGRRRAGSVPTGQPSFWQAKWPGAAIPRKGALSQPCSASFA